MLLVKGKGGRVGFKYTLSSLIYVVVWCSSRRSGRGLLCGRGRNSFMSLLVWTQGRTTLTGGRATGSAADGPFPHPPPPPHSPHLWLRQPTRANCVL